MLFRQNLQLHLVEGLERDELEKRCGSSDAGSKSRLGESLVKSETRQAGILHTLVSGVGVPTFIS